MQDSGGETSAAGAAATAPMVLSVDLKLAEDSAKLLQKIQRGHSIRRKQEQRQSRLVSAYGRKAAAPSPAPAVALPSKVSTPQRTPLSGVGPSAPLLPNDGGSRSGSSSSGGGADGVGERMRAFWDRLLATLQSFERRQVRAAGHASEALADWSDEAETKCWSLPCSVPPAYQQQASGGFSAEAMRMCGLLSCALISLLVGGVLLYDVDVYAITHFDYNHPAFPPSPGWPPPFPPPPPPPPRPPPPPLPPRPRLSAR